MKKIQEGTIYMRGSTYWIKFYRNGTPFYESTHSDKIKDARWLLNKRLGEKADNKPMALRRFVSVTELLSDVERDYAANDRKSPETLKYRIKHIEGLLGKRNAHSITGADIAAYIEHRQGEYASSATINHELKAIRRAFNLGVEHGKVATKPKVKLLRENNVRTGYFESDQYHAIRKQLPEDIQAVVDFAYITGWRKSEILSLEWRQVDFAAGRVTLDPGSTKNDQPRTFPMTSELRGVLLTQRKKTDELQRFRSLYIPWVFHRNGKPIKSFYDTWKKACEAAKIGDRRLHDFRRSAIRNFVRAGIPEAVAMKLSGHETRAVFERYNIVSEGDLDDAAGKLEHKSVTKRLQSQKSR